MNREAESRAGSFQFREIALPSRAEREIAADPYFGDFQRVDEKLLDEAVRGPPGKLMREWNDQQPIYPVAEAVGAANLEGLPATPQRESASPPQSPHR